MRPKVLLATLIAALVISATGNAAVIFQYVLDPPTTAGGGSISTQSGAGRYHLYAYDNTVGSLGIAAYDIALTGTTSNLHRTPNTHYFEVDEDEGEGDAGFPLLRTVNNVNPMIGSQPLLGNPTQLTGFGREASSFAAKLPPGTMLSAPQSSLAWGSNVTKPTNTVPNNNLPWLLIAEGQYAPGGPGLGAGTNVNLYNGNFSTQVAAQICLRTAANDCGIPDNIGDPAPDIGNLDEGLVPRNAVLGLGPLPLFNTVPPGLVWELISFTGSGEPADSPAVVNSSNGEFSWDTNGSTSVGTYSAVIRATNSVGSDTATLTFTTFVPEPASLLMIVTSAGILISLSRRSRQS
jgi:hypothetical protein